MCKLLHVVAKHGVLVQGRAYIEFGDEQSVQQLVVCAETTFLCYVWISPVMALWCFMCVCVCVSYLQTQQDTVGFWACRGSWMLCWLGHLCPTCGELHIHHSKAQRRLARPWYGSKFRVQGNRLIVKGGSKNQISFAWLFLEGSKEDMWNVKWLGLNEWTYVENARPYKTLYLSIFRITLF